MSKKDQQKQPELEYPPNENEPKGEPVWVIKEDAATALVEDSSGSIRLVPKNWLHR